MDNPEKPSGISKIFKPFKRDSSKSMILNSQTVNNSIQEQLQQEQQQQYQSPLSQSMVNPSITLTQQNSNNNNSNNSNHHHIGGVRFDETLNRSDSSSSIGSTASNNSNLTFNRPRAKSEKKEKSTFNNIIRSLRKSKIPSEVYEGKNNNSNNSNNSNEVEQQQQQQQPINLRSSSNSITSMASQDEINLNISQQLSLSQSQQHDRKSKRSSIFVRLLNRKSNTISSEDDFQIDHSHGSGNNGHGHLGERTLPPFTSTPNLLAYNNNNAMKSTSTGISIGNMNTTNNTSVEHLENLKLKEELNEIKSEFSKKQDEWHQEKEEFIKKIQLMSEAMNSQPDQQLHSHSIHHSNDSLPNVLSCSTLILPSAKDLDLNRHETISHSSSSPQLAHKSSHHGGSDNETDDFGIYNDDVNLEISMIQHPPPPLQESSIDSSFVNSLKLSTSSLNQLRSTTPTRHTRFSVSVPKLDSSMTFNGSNPFERLINILRNSTEIPHSSNSTTPLTSPNKEKSPYSNQSSPSSSTSSNNDSKLETSANPLIPLPNSNNSSESTKVLTPSILIGIEEAKQKKLILSNCLKKLISKLITEPDDSAISKTFFATYECVYTSFDIINELINQFKVESPQSQMRILIILRNWLQDYYISSLCDSGFVNLVKDFLIEIKDLGDSYNYEKILQVRNQVLYLLEGKINERNFLNSSTHGCEEVEKQFLNKKAIMKIKTFLSTSLKHLPSDSLSPFEEVPSSPSGGNGSVSPRSSITGGFVSSSDHSATLSTNSMMDNNSVVGDYRPRSSTWSTTERFISIMDAPAKEIAKSLTVVDYSIFLCIETQEIMNGAWSKSTMKDRSPNINKLIARFNDISMNVIQSILNETKLKDRCKVMARFIKIAKNLHELRNYNSLMAIYAGISHSSITRLKWTKKILPKAHQKTLQDLEKLMESDENFKNYRNELKSIVTPCIPFSGLILSDMTFIQEGNSDFTGNDENSWQINMTKLKLIYNTVKQIQQFQKKPYLLNADPRLTLLLTPNLNIFGESINVNSHYNNGNNDGSDYDHTDDDDFGQDDSINITGNDSDQLKSKDDSHIVNIDKKDRLYDSFTLEDGSTNRKSSYSSYNTWSPKKINERQPIDALFKKKSISLAQMDKNNLQITNNDNNNNNSSKSSHSLINLNRDSDKLVDSSLSSNLIQNPLPILNNINTIIEDKEVQDSFISDNNNNNSSLLTQSQSENNSLMPSPILSRNNQSQSLTSSPINNNSLTGENEQITFKSQPIRKNRGKSISTSNILTINPSSPTSSTSSTPNLNPVLNNNNVHLVEKHHSTSSSPSNYKSHSRRSSVANSSTGTSGNVSPTQNYSIVNSHSHSSFSLFKRKSLNIEPSIKSTQNPIFPPMSEETLFSLSLKLEPRGVKFSDLS